MKWNQSLLGVHVLTHALIVLTGLHVGTLAIANATPACVTSLAKTVSFTQTYGTGKAGKTYEVRIAAAEFLAEHAPGSNSTAVISHRETKDLLEGIVKDRLTEAQAERLPQYDTFLANLVQGSSVVERLKILNAYASTENRQGSVSEILDSIVNIPKPWNFSRLRIGSKKPKSQPEFLNAEQFGRALEDYPVESRIEIFRRASASLPRLAHPEAFRVLMALPRPAQKEANQLLLPYLVGRLDFFPFTLIESAVHNIELPIIAHHLRDTGGNYDLHDLLEFMSKNGMTDLQILNAIPRDAIRETTLVRELDSQARLTEDKALFFLHLASKGSRSESELRSYSKRIVSKLDNRSSTMAIELAVSALLLAGGFSEYSPSSIPMNQDFKEFFTFHDPNDTKVVIAKYELDKLHDLALSKNLHGVVLKTILRMHNYTTPHQLRDKFFEALNQDTGTNWQEKDLIAMGFNDDSVMVAWDILRQLHDQTATAYQVYALRARIIHFLTRLNGHESPMKAKHETSSEISLEILQNYLLSFLDGLRIEVELEARLGR